jgi:hypothetical protein
MCRECQQPFSAIYTLTLSPKAIAGPRAALKAPSQSFRAETH